MNCREGFDYWKTWFVGNAYHTVGKPFYLAGKGLVYDLPRTSYRLTLNPIETLGDGLTTISTIPDAWDELPDHRKQDTIIHAAVLLGTSKQLGNWWRQGSDIDRFYKQAPLKDKFLYEVGAKTLTDANYAKHAAWCEGFAGKVAFDARVIVGSELIAEQGMLRAVFMNEGSGWFLGASKTLGTGPSPAFRIILPPSAIRVGQGATGGSVLLDELGAHR